MLSPLSKSRRGSPLLLSVLIGCLPLVACDDDDTPPGLADGGDGGIGDALTGDGAVADALPALVLPAICNTDTQLPPKNLVCTGLYSDIATRTLAPGILAYAPAVPLWSDGAEKYRWIYLPPGTQIDNSDPNEWKFPVGTKLWKEFDRGGQRVETRLWYKARDGFWVDATYAWNADSTAATISAGGDITLKDGTAYHIPLGNECTLCHRGRKEHILGFEHVNLALPGATGYTMANLIAEGKLTVPPASASVTIGDDGTGVAAPALGWLHTNCGTTCHNRNQNSTAYGAGMFLRLDPTTLDGRSSAAFDPVKTTIGIMENTPAWAGKTRIVPGRPADSLIYQLITHRGTMDQMPPIASALVDTAHVALVQTWIAAMAPAPVIDAGPPDAATPDAGVDAPVVIDAPIIVDAPVVADAAPDLSPPPVDAVPDVPVTPDAAPDVTPPTADAGVDMPATVDAGAEAATADASVDGG